MVCGSWSNPLSTTHQGGASLFLLDCNICQGQALEEGLELQLQGLEAQQDQRGQEKQVAQEEERQQEVEWEQQGLLLLGLELEDQLPPQGHHLPPDPAGLA